MSGNNSNKSHNLSTKLSQKKPTTHSIPGLEEATEVFKVGIDEIEVGDLWFSGKKTLFLKALLPGSYQIALFKQ